MKKLLVVSMLFALAILLTGCPEYQLADETQRDNLAYLQENYNTQKEAFAEGEIPEEFLIEAFEAVLEEAILLEDSKAETWQEQARAEGWEEPEEEEAEEAEE